MSFISSTKAVFTRISAVLATFGRIMEGSVDGTSESASHGPQLPKDLDESRTIQWQRQWESVMTETECSRDFCYSRPLNVVKSTDIHTVYVPRDYDPGPQQNHRLPSRSCVMDILYPPSLLTAPAVLPEPPTYVPEDPLRPPATGENRSPEPSRISGGSPGAVQQLLTGDRCPTIWAELEDGCKINNGVPPPPYSRFDIARPRYAAPDTLGRYPHISSLDSLSP
ncbi:hypothetical protein EV401DRAFT_1936946 [Pisolithus croceorrhizus]|nr:hypothetical protein EV401DRAFT_1936946 [Pisolithus croceorrhizus]